MSRLFLSGLDEIFYLRNEVIDFSIIYSNT